MEGEKDFKISGKNKKKSWLEALKIIILYLIIGALWILLSDKLVNILFSNQEAIAQISIYKGWFYVLVTGAIFYVIIRSKLKLFEKAESAFLENYVELIKTNKALQISDQRYKLAVEGSNDGIWDWEVNTDVYFFSIKYKGKFGYSDEELGNSVEDWRSLFHPDDRKEAYDKVMEYLYKTKSGIYEATYRLRCKSGEYRWILSKGKGVWDSEGNPIRISGSHTDITDLREMQENLRMLAYYDKLTGLPNRLLFESEFYNVVKDCPKAIIISIDIDNFRHINNTLGYSTGDFCIRYVAKVLSETVGETDYVAKIGGEQFAILFACERSEQIIFNKIEFILKKIRRPIEYDGQSLFLTVSMGLAIYPEHSREFDTMMQNAEIAMFNRKENSKDGYTIYEHSMYEKTVKNIQMGNRLREAIKNEEFSLYYQPEVDLKTGKTIAVEALIRWQQPNGSFIPPLEFIPFSEKTGHIVEITKWVIKSAIKQKREWECKGYHVAKVAVNLSGYIITDDKAIEEIHGVLKEISLKENELEIEVTETAIMIDLEKARENLFRLRDIGVSIALDDFGTGYSSLTYLNNLPLDLVKIDREFIRHIREQNEDDSIYMAVINLSHNMNLKVLAEGVEIQEQKEFLIKNCCDIAQGYYFSKPLPAGKIEEFLH